MRCADCVYYRMDSDGIWYCSANYNDPGKPCMDHVLDRGTSKGDYKRRYGTAPETCGTRRRSLFGGYKKGKKKWQ